jgi:hypothetical protein
MNLSEFFDHLNDLIRDAESSIVNFLSAIVPWLAPITPAFMTYQHMIGVLKFPIWIATPAALVVEILGFSTVSTWLSFWFYNHSHKSEAKKAPLGLIMASFGFYLGLILFSNVILDAYSDATWAINSVRALLTMETIPAAVIVAARVQHRDLLATLAHEKKEKLEEKQQGYLRQTEKVTESYGNLPFQQPTSILEDADWRHIKPQLTLPDMEKIANLDDAGIVRIFAARQIKLSERTAGNWRKYARQEVAQIISKK